MWRGKMTSGAGCAGSWMDDGACACSRETCMAPIGGSLGVAHSLTPRAPRAVPLLQERREARPERGRRLRRCHRGATVCPRRDRGLQHAALVWSGPAAPGTHNSTTTGSRRILSPQQANGGQGTIWGPRARLGRAPGAHIGPPENLSKICVPPLPPPRVVIYTVLYLSLIHI